MAINPLYCPFPIGLVEKLTSRLFVKIPKGFFEDHASITEDSPPQQQAKVPEPPKGDGTGVAEGRGG